MVFDSPSRNITIQLISFDKNLNKKKFVKFVISIVQESAFLSFCENSLHDVNFNKSIYITLRTDFNFRVFRLKTVSFFNFELIWYQENIKINNNVAANFQKKENTCLLWTKLYNIWNTMNDIPHCTCKTNNRSGEGRQ